MLRLDLTGAVYTATWEGAEGGEGSGVDISAGGTFTLYGGDDSHILDISVDATMLPDASASDTIALVKRMNRIFDDTSSAEATAGRTEYRCLAVKNNSGGDLDDIEASLNVEGPTAATCHAGYAAAGAVTVTAHENLDSSAWPVQGFVLNINSGEVMYYSSRTSAALTVPAAGRAQMGTAAALGNDADDIVWRPGWQLYVEAPSVQPDGNFTIIANDTTDPGGVWTNAYSDGELDGPQTIGTLADGEIYGIWLKRIIPAGCLAQPFSVEGIKITFETSNVSECWNAAHIANAAGFRIYKNTVSGAAVDLSSPFASPATLPYTSGALAFPFVHIFRVRRFGGIFEDLSTQEIRMELDAAGNEIVRPNAPEGILAVCTVGGDIAVSAVYDAGGDATPATIFRVYWDNGTGVMDWVTSIGTATAAWKYSEGVRTSAALTFTKLAATMVDGTAYQFGIRSEIAATAIKSDNTDYATATCDKTGPGEVQSLGAIGGA
jgi:hypothetical protein